MEAGPTGRIMTHELPRNDAYNGGPVIPPDQCSEDRSRATFPRPGTSQPDAPRLADRQNAVAGVDRNRCQRAARWAFQHRPSCAIEFTAMGRTEQRRSVPGTDRGSSVGARCRVSDELPRHRLCHHVPGDNDSRTDQHLRLLYLDRVHSGGG